MLDSSAVPRKIIFLHAYGAPEHHQGLTLFALNNNIELVRREFGVITQMAKGMLQGDASLFFRGIFNALWLLAACFGLIRRQCVVIGIAPFDWRMLLITPVLVFNRVYWHTSWPYWDGLDGSRYPKPIKSEIVKKIWSMVLKKKIQGIFFVTNFARNNFEKSFGKVIPSSVVYHCYNNDLFFPSHRRGGRDITAAFVGRLESSKGVESIIAISKNIRELPIKIAIVGKGPLQSIVEAASDASDGRLEYLGYLTAKQLGDTFRETDFLLLPSLRTKEWEEAFGMVIIEAMACGVVPITTDHPGPTEILEGGLSANVFQESHYQGGALAIMRKAIDDPEYFHRLRIEAIKNAQSYSMESIAGRWSLLINGTANSGCFNNLRVEENE